MKYIIVHIAAATGADGLCVQGSASEYYFASNCIINKMYIYPIEVKLKFNISVDLGFILN